ncbi:unnamed protein product [Eruca vesicaria subsp. sativa]|uniref:CDC20/Fizzy WD40 domain-containing protein n=1 Tax=Eruca vesicaria subsp. sativa TaxID=29727 RepID=A0ABC8KKK7_ERUVS|nr:unnamed protein product [Eruca vesicaria subsp. sativa]
MEQDEDPPVTTHPSSSSSSSQLNLPPSMNRPTVSLETQRINRLIHSTHYHSPSKPIYSDRFIPSRSGSNFALFGLEPSPKKDGKEDGPGSYAGMLRTALFGPETPEKTDVVTGFSPSKNIFRYKTETQRPVNSFAPFGCDEGPSVSRSPVKSPRNILKSAYKVRVAEDWNLGFVGLRLGLLFWVLDAPALQDDFYLNLVDWSSQNVLAVGLGSCVYLWNACSSSVTKLCDLGGDESVCSVSWALRGTHLAIGTSSGPVEIWDALRCRRIRTMEGHRLRVGALAWSSSVLSSGSRDKKILQRDIRSQEDHVSTLTGHRSEVCGLKWSYDNRELASGGNDNKLLVWNQHSTQPVLRYCEHTAAVKAIAWSPHLHGLLASGGGTADRCIRFWNTTTNTHLSCVDTNSQVCNLAWSKNVNELVSTHGYSQNQIIVWKYPTMSKLATLTGHTFRVLYLAVSPDGQTIVTGAGDETLRFWNVFPSPKSQSRESRIGASSFGRTTIR